jgi:diguanylate cyclase (GGDEF)-like protein/PAS domain S-box-containing protein
MDMAATKVDQDEMDASALTVHMIRNGMGVISSVDESIVDLLGWRPEDLLGVSSTRFIHPDDQAGAVAAWVRMLDAPDGVGVWRGRYQSAHGTWVWVETMNHMEGADNPVVTTDMTAVTTEQISMEEARHAREQLLSRLSDALPVGVFQVNLVGNVTFTNDRLHAIVGVGVRTSVDDQLATIVPEDRHLFEAALDGALAGKAVDDIEIRLLLPATDRLPHADPADHADHALASLSSSEDRERVCLLGLRTLTDSTGVVSGAVGCLSDVTERVQLRRELEVRASTDALTSCLNRAATLELMDRTLAAPGSGVGHAVVFIDLDSFKSVNDDFGHAAGDRMLIEVANRLRDAIREGDRVGRFGGDEFLVICPQVESPDHAVEIAERIARAFTSTVELEGGPVLLRASVGVAWTTEVRDADTLIAWADRAMYDSKRLGRQMVTLCTGPDSSGGTRSVAV